jgi:hypothetical protein
MMPSQQANTSLSTALQVQHRLLCTLPTVRNYCLSFCHRNCTIQKPHSYCWLWDWIAECMGHLVERDINHLQ